MPAGWEGYRGRGNHPRKTWRGRGVTKTGEEAIHDEKLEVSVSEVKTKGGKRQEAEGGFLRQIACCSAFRTLVNAVNAVDSFYCEVATRRSFRI